MDEIKIGPFVLRRAGYRLGKYVDATRAAGSGGLMVPQVQGAEALAVFDPGYPEIPSVKALSYSNIARNTAAKVYVQDRTSSIRVFDPGGGCTVYGSNAPC